MSTSTTITIDEAKNRAPAFRPPTRQVTGRGDYRSISEGQGHRLVMDHSPTGHPRRALLETLDGRPLQHYRDQGRRGLTPCSLDVYQWGSAAA